jgi:hypothetical protein
MKHKMLKRDMKRANHVVLGLPYCFAQSLLGYENAEGYATRAEGWSCDYYNITPTYGIVEGYDTNRACTVRLQGEAYHQLAALEKQCYASNWDKAERHAQLVKFLETYYPVEG